MAHATGDPLDTTAMLTDTDLGIYFLKKLQEGRVIIIYCLHYLYFILQEFNL